MKFNLQIKLLSLVVMVVSLVLIILLLQTVSKERQIFQVSFKEKTEVLSLALDAGIGSFEELKDTAKLQSNIYKFIWLYPEIVKISISVPSPEGLKIIASNATEEIGTLTGLENTISYDQGTVLTKTLLLPDDTKVFSAITPIRVGGQRVGTYDIRFSLETEEKTIAQRQKEIALTILMSIVIIVIILFLLLSKMVVLPIAEIKKGLEMIGQGQLSWRIAPRSQDEIGDLARGVNEMSEKLEESYYGLEKKIAERTKELQEARSVLEIKVQARTRELKDLAESLEKQVEQRTKELERRLNELEKFHKLTVGRELKMMELKKELEKLKREKQK
jgi:methyl-accepting chemotaxis protein